MRLMLTLLLTLSVQAFGKDVYSIMDSKTFPYNLFYVTQAGLTLTPYTGGFKEVPQTGEAQEFVSKDSKVRVERTSGQINSLYSSRNQERERFRFDTSGRLDSVTNCSMHTESIYWGASKKDVAECTTITKSLCESFRLAMGSDGKLKQVKDQIAQCKSLADKFTGVLVGIKSEDYKGVSSSDFTYISRQSKVSTELAPYSFEKAISANSLDAYSRLINLCTQYFSDSTRLPVTAGGGQADTLGGR